MKRKANTTVHMVAEKVAHIAPSKYIYICMQIDDYNETEILGSVFRYE